MQAIPEHLIEMPLQQHTVICSKHFSNAMYQSGTISQTNLRRNAIPSIFDISIFDSVCNEDITEKNAGKVSILLQITHVQVLMLLYIYK